MKEEVNCSVLVPEEHVQVFLEKVCLPVVGCIGVLGNLGAITILMRPEMKSTFHHTLITLAVVDILFVFTLIVDIQNFQENIHNQIFIMLFPYMWNPFKNILMTFETFLMVSITTERYLAITSPLEHRLGKERYSSTRHLAVYIFPAFLLAVLVNIPKFFETELFVVDRIDDANKTIKMIDYNVTNLRIHPDYILYYTHWTRLLLTGLLPFIYLLVFNFLIGRRIRYQWRPQPTQRSRPVLFTTEQALMASEVAASEEVGSPELRVHHRTATNGPPSSSSNSILLVAIVIVYLVCNTPRLVLNLAEYLDQVGFTICTHAPHWVSILLGASHLSLTVNSSINFLIYFSLGKRFKAATKRMKVKMSQRLTARVRMEESREEPENTEAVKLEEEETC